ncbi:MAG: TolC family protein [Hydrogenophaga sp.]|uniref:TolC family protein n=1 Tax=Hydrogenophaga sp. TaxID=1904254 RepID=UPI002732887E|nr:TolC family protein [Hydrogenophaga sp.]MDP3350443.1 TolC family protein [Hydrogenophaga sp.]
MCVPKALLPQPTPARAHFRFFPSQVSSWPAASTQRGAALLGALVWCWASGTFAATPGAAGTEPGAGGPTAAFRASPGAYPASWAAQGRITLDLPGLVQLSLLHNASVHAARLQTAATAQLLNGEQALYEPALVLRGRREGADRPRTYEERTVGLTNIGKESAIERYSSAVIGLRGKMPSGASYELSQELRRRQSNLLATTTERENRGTLSLVFKQPLLRGAGRSMTEADLRIADLEQQIEQQRYTKQMLDTAAEAAGVYWQLYRAQRSLALREISLATADRLLEDSQRRVAGGVAPRVDTIDAELAVRQRQTDLARASLQIRESGSRVLNLLNLSGVLHRELAFAAEPPRSLRWERAGVPAQAPALAQGVPEPAWERLGDTWPGYQMARLRFEQEQVRLGFARNQVLPDLTLELSYNANSLTRGFRDSHSRLWEGVNPGWYVQLSLDIPLGNQRARSREDAQMTKLQAARLQLEAEAKLLGNEWLVRADQVEALWAEAQSLEQDTESLSRLVEAERLSFQHGRARARDVILIQDRLDEARVRALDGWIKAELADVALQVVDGRLLQTFGISVASE